MRRDMIDEMLRMLFGTGDNKRRVVSYYFTDGMNEPVVHVNGELVDNRLEITNKRDLFYDIFDEGERVRVVVEMPGTKKADIKVKAGLRNLAITIPGHDVCNIKLPCRVDPSISGVNYLNGILEVSLVKDEGLIDLKVD